MSLAHFYIGSFVILLLMIFKSSLYIFDNTFKKKIRYVFCQYFSPSLIFLTLFFIEEKFFILVSPAYQLFLLRIIPLMLYVKSYHHIQSHLLHCFLAVLHFTFRSNIYFDLISVKGLKSVSRFIFSMLMFRHSHTICWKHYFCSIVLSLLPYQRSVDCLRGSVSGFCSLIVIRLFISPLKLSWLL